MNLIDAQNTFALRLYDWSLRDFRRELDEGCPLLSLVGLNNYSIAAFVSWMQSISAGDRETFSKELPRRVHELAANLCGDAGGIEDQKKWNEKFADQVRIYEHSLPPPFTSYDEFRSESKRVDPDHCLDTLVTSLSPILGKPSRSKSRVRATRRIGDWKLITEFIFDRRERDLRFEYQLIRKDGAPVIGHGGLFPIPLYVPKCLFMFYGIINTTVMVYSQKDSEPMAKAMATLAEYFVARVEPMLSGLGMDD